MQDEHDQLTDSMHTGNTWPSVISNQLDTNILQMDQFNPLNSIEQDCIVNTPPANSAHTPDDLLAFLESFALPNQQSDYVLQVSSGASQLVPNQARADSIGKLDTNTQNSFTVGESIEHTHVQNAPQSTPEAWLLTDGFLPNQAPVDLLNALGIGSWESLSPAESLENTHLQNVNFAAWPLQQPTNPFPSISTYDTSRISSSEQGPYSQVPCSEEASSDFSQFFCDANSGCNSIHLTPTESSLKSPMNDNVTSHLTAQTSSSNPSDITSYSLSHFPANSALQDMNIVIPRPMMLADIIPQNGQQFHTEKLSINDVAMTQASALNPTGLSFEEWLAQPLDESLAPPFEGDLLSGISQSGVLSGDVLWDYTQPFGSFTPDDPLSTMAGSTLTDEDPNFILTTDAPGSDGNLIDSTVASKLTPDVPLPIQFKSEPTPSSHIQLDSNIGSPQGIEDHSRMPWRIPNLISPLPPSRLTIPPIFSQYFTFPLLLHPDVNDFMNSIGTFSKVDNTRIRDLLAATPLSCLPRDEHGYLSPIIIYIFLLTDKKACTDFPHKFWPKEHSPLRREDRSVECRLQSTVSELGRTAWAFQPTNCGYIAKNRRQYAVHLLGDHFGTRLPWWPNDLGEECLLPSMRIDPRSSVAHVIRKKLLEAIVYFHSPGEREISLNMFEYFFGHRARDTHGFLEPLVVYVVLLCGLSTDKLVKAFPEEQRPSLNFEYQIVTPLTCRLNSHMSDRGEAKWIRFEDPCNQELSNSNNYRRHLIEKHFGLKRSKGTIDQRIWNRFLAALKSEACRQK